MSKRRKAEAESKRVFSWKMGFTAKRLSHKAQGCRAATTLGTLENRSRNPVGVAPDRTRLIQGSRRAATLGFVAQSLRGWRALVVVLALSMYAFAQGGSSITGRITDPHGANVAGAEVHLRSRSGAQSITLTDDNGAYAFKNLAFIRQTNVEATHGWIALESRFQFLEL